MLRRFSAYWFVVQDTVERIVKKLAATDPSPTYQKSLKLDQANTGKWFLDGAKYKQWKIGHASRLWLYGVPGCGKTILSSAIIDDLQAEVENDIAKACAYHFFTFNDKAGRKSEDLIKSLIVQLIVRCVDIDPPVKRLEYGFTASNLQEALHDILVALPTVYLVIDALEECEHDQQKDLMETLSLLTSWNLGHVHILMTSRKERPLEDALAQIVAKDDCIEMRDADIDQDIYVYVRARLQSDRDFERWRDGRRICHEIESALTSGAGGM